MIAVAREEPTVVRGPDYRLPTLGQKPAEKGIIQEVSMHIVDMHDVGVDFPDSLNQLFRRPPGNQSMRIEQPRRQPMKAQIQFVSYRNQLRSMGRHPVTSPAISNVTLPAGSQRQVAQRTHDLARGGILLDDGIDLKQFMRHESTNAAGQHRKQLRCKAIQQIINQGQSQQQDEGVAYPNGY